MTQSFIEYLNAVDDALEAQTGKPSSQDHIDFIADCQEAGLNSAECIQELRAFDPKLTNTLTHFIHNSGE